MLWEDGRASCQALRGLCVSAFKGEKWNDLIDLGLSVSSWLLFLASSSSFSFSSLSSFNSYLCFSFCFEVCIQLVSIIVIIKILMGSTGFLLLSSRSTLFVKGGENQGFMWFLVLLPFCKSPWTPHACRFPGVSLLLMQSGIQRITVRES